MAPNSPPPKSPASHKPKERTLWGWLAFYGGLSLGIFLAWFIYFGLQPRLRRVIEAAPPAKSAPIPAKSAPAPAKHAPVANTTAAASQPAAEPATANDTLQRRLTAGAKEAKQRPRLQPAHATSLQAEPAQPRPSPLQGWVVLLSKGLLGIAPVVGLWAWWQSRKVPQSNQYEKSDVLEALLCLEAHQQMMTRELRLTPREIRRFANKARLQHSQFVALAQEKDSGFSFPVERQIKAFQALLLLEGDHQPPAQFPADDRNQFIYRLQAACLSHELLGRARTKAAEHPVIMRAIAKQSVPHPTPNLVTERKFMLQLYEMNAGLLA